MITTATRSKQFCNNLLWIGHELIHTASAYFSTPFIWLSQPPSRSQELFVSLLKYSDTSRVRVFFVYDRIRHRLNTGYDSFYELWWNTRWTQIKAINNTRERIKKLLPRYKLREWVIKAFLFVTALKHRKLAEKAHWANCIMMPTCWRVLLEPERAPCTSAGLRFHRISKTEFEI